MLDNVFIREENSLENIYYTTSGDFLSQCKAIWGVLIIYVAYFCNSFWNKHVFLKTENYIFMKTVISPFQFFFFLILNESDI